MNTDAVVTLRIPTDLYEKLQDLAAETQTDPERIVAQLIDSAHQRHAWRHELTALREQIIQDGGLMVGETKDEMIERLRQTRREIFEAEYAHLY